MTLRRVQILVPVGGGGGGDVDRERLIREGLENFPLVADEPLLLARILQEDTFPEPEDSVNVAAAFVIEEVPSPAIISALINASTEENFPLSDIFALFQIGLTEDNPLPEDLAEIVSRIVSNLEFPTIEDFPSIQTHIEEEFPLVEDLTFLGITTFEDNPSPEDLAEIVSRIVGNESAPIPDDFPLIQANVENLFPLVLDNPSFQIGSFEDNPFPLIFPGLDVGLIELNPTPLDSVHATINQTIAETFVPPTGEITAIVSGITAPVPAPLDNSGKILASGVRPADTVVSNTNVLNPTNITDNDADEASVTAVSSGIGGITANTVNFSLILSFADFALSELVDILSAEIQIQYRIQSNGSIGPTQNLVIDYSFNDGGSWTTFWAISTQVPFGSVALVDLLGTPALGDDWSKLNQLRIRFTGFVRSGTGGGASNTFAAAWARLVYSAEKVFT